MQHSSLFSGTLDLYQFGDEWLSYNASNTEASRVSGLDAWILHALDYGISDQHIIQDLVDQGQTHTKAANHLKHLRKSLCRKSTYQGYKQEFSHIVPVVPDKQTSTFSVVFSLLDNNITIHSNDEEIQGLILQTFNNENDDFDSQKQGFAFNIQHIETSFEIRCNHHLVGTTKRRGEVIPILMDHIQIISYQHTDYLIAIHAAMLEKDGSGIILAGRSGSGKSTLCAALNKRDYIPYSDEIALVDQRKLELSPMVLPMAIKTGSWSVLERTYPELRDSPIWKREDGRQLKYVNSHHRNDTLTTCPVKSIIFPKYKAELTETKLIKLSAVDALQEISQAGYQIKDELSKEKFERLLQWLKETPSYQIEYSNTQQSLTLMEQILHA